MEKEVVIPEAWIENLIYDPEALGYLVLIAFDKIEEKYVPYRILKLLRDRGFIETWMDKDDQGMILR